MLTDFDSVRARTGALTLGFVLAALAMPAGAGPKLERGLRHRVDTLEATVERLDDEVADIELTPGPPGEPGPPGAAGPRGEPGPPGADPQRALAELLGVESQRHRVPDAALVPADCTDGASIHFTLGGMVFGEVVGFLGDEAVSQPFFYAVAVRTATAASAPEGLLGTAATLTVTPVAGAGSVFSGIVTRAVRVASDADGALLVIHLEPRLAALRLGNDFHARQDSEVPGIVAQVLSDNAATPFELALADSYPARPYVVQYNESDLAFISRLMEEEGMFYFFTHTPGAHAMVIADRNDAFVSSSVLLHAPGGPPPVHGTETLSSFRIGAAQQVARVTVRGWDARQAAPVEGDADSNDGVGEAYEFDGAVHEAARALRLAQIGLQRADVLRRPVAGTSNSARVRAGHGVGVTGRNGDGVYHVTSVTHAALSNPPHETPGCFAYANRFTAIPTGLPFRPPRITPKPVAHGPQTATVVARTAPESAGRVKVRFHWERTHPTDPGAGIVIPVLTPAGAIPFLPEVDDEVLVGFMNGDPDRPVVLGVLPNPP